MIPMNKILVPVDFSEPSTKAVAYGVALARKFRARLLLAHIVPSLSALNIAFPADTHELERRAYTEARERLPKLIPKNWAGQLDVQNIVKGGEVRQELLAMIDEEQVHLVVMGTHGRGMFRHLILGSTTEALLRRVSVPILTVSHLNPDKEAHDGVVPVHRIIYATDLSDKTRIGLRYSIELARALGAELTLLHVLESLEDLGHTSASSRSMVRENALQRYRWLIDEERLSGVPPEITLVEDTEGAPYKSIVAFGERSKADLVVLNLHSRTSMARALLGTTAERVIRSATFPVLSLPPRDAGRHFIDSLGQEDPVQNLQTGEPNVN